MNLHSKLSNPLRRVALLAAVAALAACGGGGGDGDQAVADASSQEPAAPPVESPAPPPPPPPASPPPPAPPPSASETVGDTIAAGYRHSLFVKADGTVWSVGPERRRPARRRQHGQPHGMDAGRPA